MKEIQTYGRNKPRVVRVVFVQGDDAKSKKPTVRIQIKDGGRTNATLISVDLDYNQARQLSGALSDLASEAAAAEGRR